ncbi:flagellar hook-basal body complex protein FliE [Photobacterium toruni]|uniref:flagellar hook-basal body complex protein FliE n=1 Tax=Photobacterium toruni TaxID=1935446 RepID=UPI002110A597|nr:flagellar hook-basal body complex protein FliE [Photobacterium toruni]
MEITNTSMLMTMNRLATEASLSNNHESTLNHHGYDNAFINTINKLDESQKMALQAKKDVIEHKPNASVASMLLKSSEAQISMATAIEIRNKVLEAYASLSNMPI